MMLTPEVSTCTVYAICTGLRAYDAIITDIYDFCRFKQSFHALYSNCCQYAMTPNMLREHESK